MNPLGLGAATPEQISAAAEAKLRKMLEADCDPVPCPRCGWYQSDMLGRVRGVQGRHFKVGLGKAGVTLTVFGTIALCGALWLIMESPKKQLPFMLESGLICTVMGALTLGSGIFLVRHRNRLLREFDPNTDELREARGEEGRRRHAEAQKVLDESADRQSLEKKFRQVGP